MTHNIKRDLIGLIVGILIILLIVVSFLIYNEVPQLTGKKIILATRPVDPFNPLMGQYLQIGYEISRVNAEGFSAGDNIYVSLEEDENKIWRPISYSKTKPSSGDFILGRVNHVYGTNVNVEYGIENYYVEKGAQFSTQNITVEVSVTDSGRAEISRLLQNGKTLQINYTDVGLMS